MANLTLKKMHYLCKTENRFSDCSMPVTTNATLQKQIKSGTVIQQKKPNNNFIKNNMQKLTEKNFQEILQLNFLIEILIQLQ